MLHHYFIRMAPIERVRKSWLRGLIEGYVAWLAERDYTPAYVRTRVQLLTRFGEFTRKRGVISVDELPEHIEPFVNKWMADHPRRARSDGPKVFGRYIRNPIQQMLTVMVPEYSIKSPTSLVEPFAERAPGYFRCLRHERGLSDGTLVQHRYFLRQFEAYLTKNGSPELEALSPQVLSSFVTELGQKYCKKAVHGVCCILKTFLRYLHRENITARELSKSVEAPRLYRLSHIPRSISWDDVRKLLERVDLHKPIGKRDYAILLLLVTYGLRAREVSALTLDDIDWRHERLYVRQRKAGHSTAYPLSTAVGNAITDYLRAGRPRGKLRRLFFNAIAPHGPITAATVSLLAQRYLREAGIEIRRPGSHTLRHTCIQRLLDAHFNLKTIGDYVGHKSADATQVYTKVDIDRLREVALGDGEAIL